ncbi:bacterial transcriptional regulator family protein [Burkholderia pseudomallei]|nr:bacterial transcriptional regulator family protein [Burkholderia pseudomallei]
MVAIDVIRPRSAVLVTRLETGSRMDIARTAVGRAYLAALEDDARRELIGALQAAAGDDWPFVVSRLNAALADIAQHGYAIAIGEWREELNAIAAGFVAPTGQCYAVNCGGSAHQCTPDFLRSVAVPALRECIAKITREIGGAAWPNLAR